MYIIILGKSKKISKLIIMDNNITIYKNFISFKTELEALKYVENALNFINTSKEKHKEFIFQDESYSSTVELVS